MTAAVELLAAFVVLMTAAALAVEGMIAAMIKKVSRHNEGSTGCACGDCDRLASMFCGEIHRCDDK